MTHLTTLDELKQHITLLASVLVGRQFYGRDDLNHGRNLP